MRFLTSMLSLRRRPLAALGAGIAAALVLLVATPGCDSALDLEPQGEQTAANFFITADDAQRSLAATYDAIQQQVRPTYQGAPGYLAGYDMVFGSVASDNAIKGGESGNDQPDMAEVDNFAVTPANQYVAKMWSSLYTVVTRANRVIVNVPEIDMDEALRADLIAEARFLRAYANFYLLQSFGMEPGASDGPGIVLLTGEVSIADADRERVPESEVWAQIEEDLAAAAGELPTKGERSSTEYGRATRGAANALLAKAHIFQEEWSDAAARAQDVISSGEYSLTSDYSQIFTLAGEHGSGSIFEISYSSILNQEEGYYGNVYQASRATWGFGFKLPTQDLVDAFEGGDERQEATIIFPGEEMSDGTVPSPGASPTGFHSEKIWIPESAYPQNNGQGIFFGPSNVRYLRLANVLLWHAEALAQMGDTAGALESLNEVRSRAGLPDATASGGDLIDTIYHERRVELAMEDLRFFDLVRQGRAADLLAEQGFDDGTHQRMPIPQREVDISEGSLEQNPGY